MWYDCGWGWGWHGWGMGMVGLVGLLALAALAALVVAVARWAPRAAQPLPRYGFALGRLEDAIRPRRDRR